MYAYPYNMCIYVLFQKRLVLPSSSLARISGASQNDLSVMAGMIAEIVQMNISAVSFTG